MDAPRRVYLDNAATSWPKPESVYLAVERYLRQLGAPAGRGAYREAAEVERLMRETRQAVADLLDVADATRIVFASNGTDALNLAIHGLLRAGDHVVTSAAEHNSVLRPLRALQEEGGIEVTRVATDSRGVVDPNDFRRAIRPNTRLLVLVHASNVTGALQPVDDVGRIAADRGLIYLVDAAQTLGHLPITPRSFQAHLLAAPGHKGLLGPLSSGILYLAEGMEKLVRSLRQGGTGTASETDRQPETLPDKYESGNHPVPAILGLGAGIHFLRKLGLQAVRQHHQQLTSRLLRGLSRIDGVSVFGPGESALQVGVVSITVEGYEPQEVADVLDSAYSIQVRAGIHCAPAMHQALGTMQNGGTVRFSPGVFTTQQDIDDTVKAVGEIAMTSS